MTFTEKEGEDTIRLIYRGPLPSDLYGGDPVLVGVGGSKRNYAFRLYDSGWTPMTGRHLSGTPESVKHIDEDALEMFLLKSGKLDGKD